MLKHPVLGVMYCEPIMVIYDIQDRAIYLITLITTKSFIIDFQDIIKKVLIVLY